MVYRVVDFFCLLVYNVDIVIIWVFDKFFYVVIEVRKVGGDVGDIYDGVFSRSVVLRFVVGWEDVYVVIMDEVVIIEWKNGVSRV